MRQVNGKKEKKKIGEEQVIGFKGKQNSVEGSECIVGVYVSCVCHVFHVQHLVFFRK